MALKTTPLAQHARSTASLLVVAALSVLLIWGWQFSLPIWLLLILLLYLYRSPLRRVPAAPLGIISPVDGVVSAVEHVTDELLKRPALRITINVPLLGPYVVRSPTEGKVMRYWAKSSSRCCVQWVQTDEQEDVLLSVRSVALIGSVHFRVAAGQRIGQGACCGVMRFVREAELHLPDNSVLNVKKGDTVLAGEDILATLVHSAN